MKVKQKFILFGLFSFALPCILLGYLFLAFRENTESFGIDAAAWNRIPEYVIHNYLFITIAAASIIALLYFLIGMVVLNNLLNPLIKLKKTAERIRDGDLNSEIIHESDDEFGEVFDTFEQMRAQLKDSLTKRAETEIAGKEMIVNIAHDLKTPVTAISGYALGILEGVADTDEKKEKYLKTIIQRSKDISRMAEDLSLFAKLEANKIFFELNSLNMFDCVKEIAEEFLKEYHVGEKNKKELSINVHAREGMEGTAWKPSPTGGEFIVKIDPLKFRRIAENIISNSIKYSKDDKTEITIDVYENSKSVITKFTDCGKGIPESGLPHIFERFYRIDSARTESGKGSGLGLAIVKYLADAQGGKVWARSVEGEWTSIYVSFPKLYNL